MKRLLSIVLVVLSLFPLLTLAEESFFFRGRYTWGMSLDEVKQQAAEEGLIYKKEQYLSLYYQDVPAAGIVAQELTFHIEETIGLDLIMYTFTNYKEESIALYAGLLEQLTHLYGEPYEIETDRPADSPMVRWRTSDTHISLFISSYNDSYRCCLGYLAVEPEPTPLPLNADGL